MATVDHRSPSAIEAEADEGDNNEEEAEEQKEEEEEEDAKQ